MRRILVPSIYKNFNLPSELTKKSTSSSIMTGTGSSLKRQISSTNIVGESQAARVSSVSSQKQETNAQSSLPKLPVPPLNDTLSKYLRTVKPLLSEEEFESTVKLVKEFGNGDGQKLQMLLQERAAKKDNWLSDWWLDKAYLEFRSPVVIHSSPGLVFPLEEFKSKEDQLAYASKLIFGALCYKKLIDTNKIPAETMGKAPLDMSQYKKIFGTNRNPGAEKDYLSYNPQSTHIVVGYKNYFHKVIVYNENGDILSPNEIYQQLNYIIENTSGLCAVPIGLLTSEHRDIWGKIYPKLKKDALNEMSLQSIDESLFYVAIDRSNRPLVNPQGGLEGVENFAKSEKQTVAARQMIHGNLQNSGNRWFDKTIQFIIGVDGECGLCYEHSPAEGPPIANMMDFIVNNIPKFQELLSSPETLKNNRPKIVPQTLAFNISDKLTKYISEAKSHLEAQIDDLDMACFTFLKYGKDFIKTCKFSPDSYIQMAIQATFYKYHQVPGSHYESASTRMFKNGRTETIRSCSSESIEFAKALLDKSVSDKEKYNLMKRSIDGHKFYAAQAVQGLGVDRVLMGLKTIAVENQLPIPDLFKDIGYTKSSSFRISTSQVPSIHQAFMCYGPLVTDGYGCCYNPRPTDISFGISAFNSNQETSAEKFKITLQETLLDMEKVALQSLSSKL